MKHAIIGLLIAAAALAVGGLGGLGLYLAAVGLGLYLGGAAMGAL